MNIDISVAPEIAQLELGGSRQPVPQPAAAGRPATVGALSRELTRLAATPQRWWDLVRFDPDRPVRITLPGGPGYEAWLLVMPPGAAGECHCDLATLIAGEAAEEAGEAGEAGGEAAGPGRRPAALLRPGRVLVHGSAARGHAVRSGGRGYSVTVHAGAPFR